MSGAVSPSTATISRWRRFWDRGGVWRALLLAAGHYGIYLLLARAVDPLVAGVDRPAGGAMDVLLDTALPIALIVGVLLAFAGSLGWLPELFGKRRADGRWWMWIGVGTVGAINVASLLSIDYAAAGSALVLSWLLAGLCVGVAEELVTRGFVVDLMRRGRHGELAVGLTSAGIFAALHFGNLFTSDQGLAATMLQLVYTFAFGLCMYFALRLTGTLVAPIVLHASTDPTLTLHAEHPVANVFGVVSFSSTFLVIGVGFALLVVFVLSEHRRATAPRAGARGRRGTRA